MKKVGLLIVSLAMIFSLAACDFGDVDVKDETIKSGEYTSTNGDNNATSNQDNNGEKVELETNDKYAHVTQNPVVTMEMENGDIVKMELYPQIAPTTVENFISLIKSGYYNGLTFHRVIPVFMAQGGDPSGDGTGGPGYSIKGEFADNGFKNELSHEIGVVSMARASAPNSAGSQFFIVTNEQSYQSLDNLYAGFGKVIEGMDAVYTIVNTEVIRTEVDDDVYMAALSASMKLNQGQEPTDDEIDGLNQYYKQAAEKDRPINPPVIKSMTVETFGVEYDEPEKITE